MNKIDDVNPVRSANVFLCKPRPACASTHLSACDAQAGADRSVFFKEYTKILMASSKTSNGVKLTDQVTLMAANGGKVSKES